MTLQNYLIVLVLTNICKKIYVKFLLLFLFKFFFYKIRKLFTFAK